DDGDARTPRGGVERADAGHEIARIGQVEIGHARTDAGERHVVAAVLERTSGVDQQVRAVIGQQPVDIAVAVGNDGLGAGKAGAKDARLFDAAAGDQDMMPPPGQPPRQPRAEAAIAAKDEDPAQSTRRACSAVGSQQVVRRPNRR
ncbi:MAG: hypothetical protein JWN66_1752, partial [Sphingomonas bacterium]|nr:hypothetical protein [Sphingomonas bacterium]